MTIRSNEYVLWFQITIENVVFVEVLDGENDLTDVILSLLLGEATTSLTQNPGQVATSTVFQNDEELLLVLE